MTALFLVSAWLQKNRRCQVQQCLGKWLPLILLFNLADVIAQDSTDAIELGTRPHYLVSLLSEGELKKTLTACEGTPPIRSTFSIGHRGAPLEYPEHTREGYLAAAKMGAGIIECDVTFTKDKELVCRHSQCDLHTTTDILQTELAAQCLNPPDYASATPFSDVQCCTTDISAKQFLTLKGTSDRNDKLGTLMTHRQSIQLFKSLGVKMIPELKQALVAMPYKGKYTQQEYAQAIVDEYKLEGIEPESVFLQSFSLDDIQYWLKHEPQFAKQAAYLDGRYKQRAFNIDRPSTWSPSMQELADAGVNLLASPLWMLLTTDSDKNMIPSAYALAAKAAGLDLMAWTLERSGPLTAGGGWYYQSVSEAIKNDSDKLRAMHVLSKDIGVRGIFSDWPATVSYYASCLELND